MIRALTALMTVQGLEDKLGKLKDQLLTLRTAIKSFETDFDARLDACLQQIVRTRAQRHRTRGASAAAGLHLLQRPGLMSSTRQVSHKADFEAEAPATTG